jgi:RNA polymerase sigma-70 factor, ECF subfamily
MRLSDQDDAARMESSTTIANDKEAELIARVSAGDHEAFYELVRPYERTIYLAALSILKNDADTEEVAQEVVLKAFKNLASFRGEARFSTWLVQITVNEARGRIRKYRPSRYESIDESQTGEDGDYLPKDFADWRPIPSQEVENKHLRMALKRGLESLGEKDREVFVLRDVQGLSTAETAAALGVNEAIVKTRLLRARLMMRDALAPGWDGGWRAAKGQYKKVRPW